ncbi:MAG: polysaccharide deacetylase family protein [Chthoniobacterales bacterium]|nr:polysaccharide deacetylase family protein [Chthoniobacterales bacterium]
MIKAAIFSFFVLLLGVFPSLSTAQENASTPAPAPTVPASPPVTVSPAAMPEVSSQNSASQKPAVNSASSVVPCRKYCSIPVDGPYLALAFDDGPSATLTLKLLDLLKAKGVKVTFFVIGENAASHPEILARAVAEGHEIGNHTWDHPQLTKLSDVRIQEEVNKTSEVILQATGKKPLLLRPPYGAINARVSHLVVDEDGMKMVLWSVDPMDWKRPGSAVVAQRLIAGAKPGAIMLAHDIHPGTIEAIPTVIDALLAKGYHFVTVSELIAMESQAPQPAVAPTTASGGAPTPVVHKKHRKKSL